MSSAVTEGRMLTGMAGVVVVTFGWLFHLLAESQRSHTANRQVLVQELYSEFKGVRKDISGVSERVGRLEEWKLLTQDMLSGNRSEYLTPNE